MIWCYFIIILLLCPNTTISTANQLAAARERGGDGNGDMNMCIEKERLALLDFKDRLQDPDGRLLTWRPEEDDDCCKWKGITCNNQTGHVIELNLPFDSAGIDFLMGIGLDGLRGEISPSLVNLTYLNHLDLSYNSFFGTIPSSIGSLTQLRYLDLGGNQLSGTVELGSMTELRYLDLSSNHFQGTIPNIIGSMTRLAYLNLGYNSFNETIPKSIGSLTDLRHLDLSYNSLHGTIPSEFGNLTNLQNLSLGVQPLSYSIENLDWLSNLSHLQHLQMDGISLAKQNHWVDVILSLRKLSFLSLWRCDLSEVMHPYSSFVNYSSSSIGYLDLKSNNLNSSMYRWLFPLTSNRLVHLDLSYNMLDGIPKYLGNLCALTDLFIYGNTVVVKFPDFLNSLSGCTSLTLQVLAASASQFTGSLPDEIQKFSSLQSLTLSDNHLNGTMSEKVLELPNLQNLDVSSNSLRGVISEHIVKSKLRKIDLSNNLLELIPSKTHMLNLSHVEYLDLTGCKLGPLFPKWIQTHKNLTYLDISNTSISDTIPVEFWKTWPPRLTYFNLRSNNISGKVLDLSSNFGLHSTIDLSSNSFYGPIQNVPSTLLSLNLSRNKFYGGISFLCQIVDGLLSFLDLSHNSFTGQLPDCLWHFQELKVLNLGYNNLSGRLPASIGYLVKLEVLHVYNNNFSGELPLDLKNCKGLEFLNLGANKFFGNVPVWIGKELTGLYGLSLKSNNLFGPIPLQVCHLMKLQFLDLSINNLNGTIPSCLNNLNAMVEGGSLSGQNMHSFWMAYSDRGIYSGGGTYVDNVMIEWQGNEREFTNNLGLLISIDLSSNNLTGRIPNELADLHELLALNLSKNALYGEIPRNIGEMKKLLSLDLSRNNFSGRIPSSMSQVTSLNYLDVSHNNLSGRIPSSTQLQSFEPSKFTGNAGLCGPPLTKNCPGDEVPPVANKSESVEEGADEVERWFYIGGSIGFATGFWIACGGLLVNRRGRHAFFLFLDFLKDWVYVKVVFFIRKLQRVLQHT